MPRVDLSVCPDCRYDLRAHAPPNRCPECGFEYDEFTSVWRPKHPIAAAIPALILVAFVLSALIYMRRSRIDLAYCLIAILLVIVLIHRAWRASMAGQFVAITPRGFVGRSDAKTLVVPWEKVVGFKRGIGEPIHVEGKDEEGTKMLRSMLSADGGFARLDIAFETKEFYVEAVEARKRYVAGSVNMGEQSE